MGRERVWSGNENEGHAQLTRVLNICIFYDIVIVQLKILSFV